MPSRPSLARARRAKDAEVAARVMARPGEAETLLAAWRRFRPMVRWVLIKMIGADDEDLPDLSQEAFLQLCRSVGTLRSADSMRPFVTGIAIRVALREMRRRRVRGGQVLVPGQGLLPLASTEADPEAREALVRLVHLVGRMRASDRDMFVLRQVMGLEQTEICTATKLSISTVRRRLRRLQRRVDLLTSAEPALAHYAGRPPRRPRG
jgi:RNA polymerase sigma-70 factor, ECF subfamily